MKVLKELGMVYDTEFSKHKARMSIFECPKCEKAFRTRTTRVNTGKITQCKSCSSTKHGMNKTRLYGIWSNMKQRCYNQKCDNFHHYGGKGVVVAEEWTDFVNFKNWAFSNGYTDNLSIDRMNNDGNYEPNNCRWTTREIQGANTRKIRSSNTSGYRGVSEHQGKWQAQVRVDKKDVYLGIFSTALEGAQAYDKHIIYNNLEHTINGVKI